MIVKKIIKITIPICVVLVVAISVVAALLTKEESILANEETAVYTETETATVTANSADNPLIADSVPEVNALVETYLTALADGDEETYRSITNNMTDITRIRIAELGKYIEGFPAYNAFTKIGPLEGSYVVFVAVRAQLVNLEVEMPGIYNLYVCTDENGNLYINEDTVTEEEQQYIAAVNADASVIELQESFNQEYKALLDSNETARTYIELMNNEIRGAVGAALASIAAENAAETQSAENAYEDPTILHKDCEAVATDTINVRSSDSETADKVGKLSKGTNVHIIEMRVNGWTKITYEGKEAYVKNDYLEVQLPPEEAGTGENVANGKVTATTKVNVRAQASASASRLGQVDAGTVLDWIADVDGGFSKVIFEGKVGYIATEFLIKQ